MAKIVASFLIILRASLRDVGLCSSWDCITTKGNPFAVKYLLEIHSLVQPPLLGNPCQD